MQKQKTVAILGGDGRQVAVAAYFCEKGYCVRAFGLPQDLLPEKVQYCKEWYEAVASADAVILPLPALPDGKHVGVGQGDAERAPLFSDILQKIAKETLLAGGRFPPAAKAEAERKGRVLLDYFESEALQEKNAIPTAEGAVFVLMKELPVTVSGTPVTVTGYGRVAKALAALLLSMGAEVTVAARKESDRREAAAKGCLTVAIDGKEDFTRAMCASHIIFNTVPHWLFDAKLLEKMKRDTLIIDLASSPGGVDAAAAAARGIRVIWALSLPGKYAPVTAGRVVAETVLEALSGEVTG